MEPGWQRNVVVGVVLAVWVAGRPARDGRRRPVHGRGPQGLYLVALLGVLAASRAVASLGTRFAVTVVAVAAVQAAYQLSVNGRIGWAWLAITALGIATVMTGVEAIFRRREESRRSTAPS